MGVLDKAASAFLSVVHVLSLLRPGGKRQSGETKLSVTVHEGKVGRQSQGKYLVTMRHGKEKVQTAKKKSDALTWEHSTEFMPWSPTDQLVLKLRKAKRCKDTTVGELSIDVAAALESADGLPQKWWYIMDRPSKGGRRNAEVFLQVSVTLDGTEVNSQPTQNQVPANPPEGTVEASSKGEPDTLSELQNHQVKAAEVSKENENEADTPRDSSAKDSKPPSVAGDIADVKLDSSDTVSTSDTGDEFVANEDRDVPLNNAHRSFGNTDVAPLQVSGAADGPECELLKGQDPAKTSEGTVKTELQVKPELEDDKINISQEKEPDAPSDSSGKDSSPPAAAGDAANVKTASSTSPASVLPATAPDTADKRPAAGEGDVPERYPPVVHREQTEAPDNRDRNTDSQTTSSTQEGGGASLATTTPSPKHKDAEDPQYEEVMSSVDKLWAELHLERDYAEKLLAHADSLRSRLATTAPHVLQYPVIKNIIAAVPDRTSYKLPDTQGLSLQELKCIQKTLTKSVQDEKERGTYIKCWYWEELVRVALKEAPEVFGPED
ncbi:uncharacterized protein LOC118410744 [Branchiostoma floridae]|uniref:Uncharacterized protein LOC118410744 n=1 Tax=Branchiostoma floridae TaxID=7739 RepID=C3ZHA2_BRAFL|nr:uncharacterized protein LOC118410744 [Branchiostoma floridae]|eukprot:XP_002592074.1 hypothetical protein BRAFLDRAFT_104757 [Branchiostoma floridae]